TVVPFPTGYDSFFFNSPDVPKVALKVESLLNIQMKVSRLNIVVTPWTLFESSDENYPYGFTYITHDIISDNLNNSIGWIQDYVERKKGEVILTDFDEETNSLNAKFPLNSCVDGVILNSEIMKYCQEVKRKFR
ncbi:MAG: hypothetical protein L0220_30450, partial [Acidobacteria bacterium]|nr:hypothetical protein [Acidobacteriota bacterium]